MLRKIKPREESPSLYVIFYEKSVFKTAKAYRMHKKNVYTLLTVFNIQKHANTRLTARMLEPLLNGYIKSVKNQLTVLESKGMIKEVPFLYARKNNSGKLVNKGYDLTAYGETVIKFFTEQLNKGLEAFREKHQFRPIKKEEVSKLERMGMLRSKKKKPK
jgi:hypothetical protein